MTLAGVIRGHVTDTDDHPLDGICAQATTDAWFGGLARTDANGDYVLTVSRAGGYRVQFVDCTDSSHVCRAVVGPRHERSGSLGRDRCAR